MKITVTVLMSIVVITLTIWAAGAFYFSPLLDKSYRPAITAIFVVVTVLGFIFLPRRGWTLLGFLSVFCLLVAMYFNIPASNDRNWQPEVAVTPYATIKGDLVTIHGVRNFDYRTETDFDTRWETRTYDLQKLDSADLIAVYWAGKTIAHIMISFGFEGQDYLTFSIETRKERDEGYSTIAGFFRQYELVYVIADERDVIRVRTNYRQPQEDVYVYRLRTPLKNIRRVFMEYIKTVNDLQEHPSFYNTLTTNCTTSILLHTRVNPESPPMSWKILLSGFVPEYLYELRRIDGSRSFADLEKLSHVNARAQAADKDPNFSQRIRGNFSSE